MKGGPTVNKIFQFKIELLDISPPIWRRIQVPEGYTFWDLHVAIQDSMGWTDSHLHAFRIYGPGNDIVEIGLPDPYSERDVTPDWELKLSKHFRAPGDRMEYEYDFGDSWRHSVVLEEVSPAEPGAKYPRCIEGERNCPPEDVGGPPGFEGFLEAIADPGHEEHEDLLEWCGGSFDPDDFNSDEVEFDDPGERLKLIE